MEISPVNTGYGYANSVSKKEQKMVEKVFKDAQKTVKKSEVRDADWGLYAAQNCLAKQLVNADAEEMGLILDKMNYIQTYMNNNLQLDSDLEEKTKKLNNDSLTIKAEMRKNAGEAAPEIIRSATDLAKVVVKPSQLDGVKALGKAINLAA